MTVIGKLLVFLNLVFGIGIAVWSTAAYSQRPSWFSPAPEGGVDKGHSPLAFAQLGAEIDNLGKVAVTAGGSWGAQYKALQTAEQIRADRHIKMFGTLPDGTRAKTATGADVKGLIGYAKDGHPQAEGNAGFFQLKEEPNGKLFDLGSYVQGTGELDPKTLGKVVLGPNNQQPLAGAGTLLERYNTDAAAVTDMAYKSADLRAQQKKLGAEVVLVDDQVIKQRVIRDNLINEASYLGAFEVNVVEQRETVVRRRTQLRDRLVPFGAP
ncbi:MAG: hypothetical protein JWO38_3959 [Gemmataceae bacterium]|nr:hypothetical protein [Gemmataceae bacterium]